MTRVALGVAMYGTARTDARPSQMRRGPRQAPLSRLKGATPTSAATCWRVQRPSSGISASKVAAVTGPRPRMLCSQAARHPRHSPAQTAPAVEQGVLALRVQHPAWGARKLRVLLTRQNVQPLPAVSALTAILRRHDALDPAQGTGQPHALQRFEHPYPNALWQMDFKAGWPCGPGRCHPLTILDDHSLYALGLGVVPGAPPPAAQGAAGAAGRLSADGLRRLLGYPLSDL